MKGIERPLTGDDILIGGFTTFDNDLVGIMQLFSSNPSNPGLLVADQTVFDETVPVSDTMDGNSGSDLYFANLISPAKDAIKLTREDQGAIDIDSP